LADFDAVCFIELLKTTQVTWAKKIFSKVKIGPTKEEKHHFRDALAS